VEVDDAYLGGERSDGTTGRGTSGQTPFVAAVQTTVEGQPVRVKFSRVAGFTREDIKCLSGNDLPSEKAFRQ
jgi:hypothetical protein